MRKTLSTIIISVLLFGTTVVALQAPARIDVFVWSTDKYGATIEEVKSVETGSILLLVANSNAPILSIEHRGPDGTIWERNYSEDWDWDNYDYSITELIQPTKPGDYTVVMESVLSWTAKTIYYFTAYGEEVPGIELKESIFEQILPIDVPPLILDSKTFDVPPRTIDGIVFVPLRVIFEACGMHVHWINDRPQTILVTNQDAKGIWFQINSPEVRVVQDVLGGSGESSIRIPLDAPPQLTNGRTFVPLNAISESLGLDVQWDSDTQTIIIIQ